VYGVLWGGALNTGIDNSSVSVSTDGVADGVAATDEGETAAEEVKPQAVSVIKASTHSTEKAYRKLFMRILMAQLSLFPITLPLRFRALH
jgi:hypothetical protein